MPSKTSRVQSFPVQRQQVSNGSVANFHRQASVVQLDTHRNSSRLVPSEWIWLENGVDVCVPCQVVEYQPRKKCVIRPLHEAEIDIKVGHAMKLLKCSNEVLDHNADDLLYLPNVDNALDFEILHTLRERFKRGKYYTQLGSFMIYVNPARLCRVLYTPHVMKQYIEHQFDPSQLPPHIFKTARTVYSHLLEKQEHQSVIIVGHPGSGKTESANLMLQYFCKIRHGGSQRSSSWSPSKPTTTGNPRIQSRSLSVLTKDSDTVFQIEQQLMYASTILEAFGNCCTKDNKNSSRFAKLLSLDLNKHGNIVGGAISGEFLEKSRVLGASQSADDLLDEDSLNFHVFYQIMAAAQEDEELREQMFLDNETEKYRYLSSPPTEVTFATWPLDLPNAQGFESLANALSALRFSQETKMNICRIVVAILHIGNIEFQAGTGALSDVSTIVDPRPLTRASKLLEVEPSSLEDFLLSRLSRDGSLHRVATEIHAQQTRDMLSKTLYGQLFAYLAEEINITLGRQFDRFENSNIQVETRGIHILDVNGFQSTSTPSRAMDNMCTNYWNEKIRAMYLANSLRQERKAYESQELRLSHYKIQVGQKDRDSSQAIIDAFENSPDGIFPIIDEMTRNRKNDDELVAKLLTGNSQTPLNIIQVKRSSGSNATHLFSIQHSYSQVTYDATWFIHRNSESNTSSLSRLYGSSTNSLILELRNASQLANNLTQTPDRVKSTRRRRSSARVSTISVAGKGKTACAQFHCQVSAMLDALMTTEHHYIMCVRANREMADPLNVAPVAFDSAFANGQLQSLCVPQIVEMKRIDFSVQIEKENFFRLYCCLCGNRGTLDSLLRSLTAIGLLVDDDWAEGTTKIFLRTLAHERLQTCRNRRSNECALIIQKNFRNWLLRSHAKDARGTLLALKKAMIHRETETIEREVAKLTQFAATEPPNHAIKLEVQAARKLLVSLEKENNVSSILQLALMVQSPKLIEFALGLAAGMPSYKSHALVSLRQERQRLSKTDALNRELKEAVEKRDVEKLMSLLSITNESIADSEEQRQATILVICLLEATKALELVQNALTAQDFCALEEGLRRVFLLGLEQEECAINALYCMCRHGKQMELFKALKFAYKNKSWNTTACILKMMEGTDGYQSSFESSTLLKQAAEYCKENKDTRLTAKQLKLDADTLVEAACLTRDSNFIASASDDAQRCGVAEWHHLRKRAKKLLKTIEHDDMVLSEIWKSLTLNESTLTAQAKERCTSWEARHSFCFDLVTLKLDRKQRLDALRSKFADFVPDFHDISTCIGALRGIIKEAFEAGLTGSDIDSACHLLYDLALLEQTEVHVQKFLAEIKRIMNMSPSILSEPFFQKVVPIISGDYKQAIASLATQLKDHDRPLVSELEELQNKVKTQQHEAQEKKTTKVNIQTRESGKSSGDISEYPGIQIEPQNYRWEGNELEAPLLSDLGLCEYRLKVYALHVNKCVLGYMRDSIAIYHPALAHAVIEIGLVEQGLMSDEIYIQVIKQLIMNPRLESFRYGWILLSLCSSAFMPTPDLLPYVTTFVKNYLAPTQSSENISSPEIYAYANYCLCQLSNKCLKTMFIPNLKEIHMYSEHSPVVATIELLDHTTLTKAMPISPMLKVADVVAACCAFLKLPVASFGNTLGLFLQLGHKSMSEICLPPKSFVGDMYRQVLNLPTEVTGLRGSSIRLCLKFRLISCEWQKFQQNAMAMQLLYLQLRASLRYGSLRFQRENDMRVMYRLLVMSFMIDAKIEGNDLQLKTLSQEIWNSASLNKHLSHLDSLYSYDGNLRDGMIRALSELDLENSCMLDLQRRFVSEMQLHSCFGAIEYKVQPIPMLVAPLHESPEIMILAVNANGVHFLSACKTRVYACYGHPNITSCLGHPWNSSKFQLTVPRLNTSCTLNIGVVEPVTSHIQTKEIMALIQDYKEWLVTR